MSPAFENDRVGVRHAGRRGYSGEHPVTSSEASLTTPV